MRYSKKNYIMATLTLHYDERNKTARCIVEMLRSLDLFQVSSSKVEEREWTAEEEREAFLCTSKKNAARIFADKL